MEANTGNASNLSGSSREEHHIFNIPVYATAPVLGRRPREDDEFPDEARGKRRRLDTTGTSYCFHTASGALRMIAQRLQRRDVYGKRAKPR